MAAVKLEGKAYCVLKASKSAADGGTVTRGWDSSKRWSRQRGLDQPLWDRDRALDFGGDGVAPDDLATAVSTGTSLSNWPGQRQTRQEALGRSSSTAFSD